MILFQLFLTFLQVGLFSVGGGYAAMPLIQSLVVESNGWLTMEEFTDLVTIAEMTPGPIVVNAATFVGIRLAGIAGAVAATFGSVFPSMVLVSLLAVIYYKYKNITTLQNVLGYLRPAVVALIASAGLRILMTVVFNGMGISVENFNFIGVGLFLFALLLIRHTKCSPILAMLLCGVGNLVVHLIR